MAGAIVVGDQHAPPNTGQGPRAWSRRQSVIVNLLGVQTGVARHSSAELSPGFCWLCGSAPPGRTGCCDEAHQCCRANAGAAGDRAALRRLFLITVHPDKLAPAALAAIDTVIVVGKADRKTLAGFASIAGWPAAQPDQNLEQARGVHTGSELGEPFGATAHLAATRGAPASCPQIRRRKAGNGQELLLPRRRPAPQSPRPQSRDFHADGRRRRQRYLALSPAQRRLFPVVPRSDQG